MKSVKSNNVAGAINDAGIIYKDVSETRQDIEKMTGTNETLKEQYLKPLKTVEDASFTIKNTNFGTLLASSDWQSTYYKAGRDLFSGLKEMVEVESTWNESVKDVYKSQLREI